MYKIVHPQNSINDLKNRKAVKVSTWAQTGMILTLLEKHKPDEH